MRDHVAMLLANQYPFPKGSFGAGHVSIFIIILYLFLLLYSCSFIGRRRSTTHIVCMVLCFIWFKSNNSYNAKLTKRLLFKTAR